MTHQEDSTLKQFSPDPLTTTSIHYIHKWEGISDSSQQYNGRGIWKLTTSKTDHHKSSVFVYRNGFFLVPNLTKFVSSLLVTVWPWTDFTCMFTMTKLEACHCLHPVVLPSFLPWPTSSNSKHYHQYSYKRPASWSSGQSLCLLIMRSRVRFPALPWEFSLKRRIPAVTMVWVG